MLWRNVPDARGKNTFKEHAGKGSYDNHAAAPNAIHQQPNGYVFWQNLHEKQYWSVLQKPTSK